MSRDAHISADADEEPTSSRTAGGGHLDEVRDPTDDEPPAPVEELRAEEGRSSRVLKFARRLMDRRELAEDTKELLHAVLTTSDKAKTEAVRLMAREFRAYLKELRLKEDLIKLVTSHSLEISISLKPLSGSDEGGDE